MAEQPEVILVIIYQQQRAPGLFALKLSALGMAFHRAATQPCRQVRGWLK
jgi:hypothetical protein